MHATRVSLVDMSGNPARPAAFFDLDKTIIAKSSALAFSKPFYNKGLLSKRSVLRSGFAQFMFALNGADHDKLAAIRDEISRMVAGWDVGVVHQTINETLHEIIEPMIFAEAIEIIEMHRAQGLPIVIVSASGQPMVDPIGVRLGADHVIATQMSVLDDKFTGEITFYASGPNKAEAMRELAMREGFDLDASFAYSDSITDVPMLESVGHPNVVNPDKALRQRAEDSGWPILEFERPVALSSQSNYKPSLSQVAVGGAILGTAAIAGVVGLKLRSKLGRAV